MKTKLNDCKILFGVKDAYLICINGISVAGVNFIFLFLCFYHKIVQYLISLVSSSTTAQQIIPKMPAVLHINHGVLWTPFVSSNLFNHNYYITGRDNTSFIKYAF